MIRLDWEGMKGDIGNLMARYDELPRHIAKKHLNAVIKRSSKDGVSVLKGLTPIGRKMRPNSKGVVKMRRSGDLRRAVIAKSAYKGRNKGGYAYGVIGYKYGSESMKAIFLEFGTKSGIVPRQMVAKLMEAWGGPTKEVLMDNLAEALERAVRELESGMNPYHSH